MTSSGEKNTKTWELSLYELQRKPQEAIIDETEILISPSHLHSELMCPICLEIMTNTMTTKECLHRFCAHCIITALRNGNKECPTCRKKLVSKRSLRHDPIFDALIAKICPNRDAADDAEAKLPTTPCANTPDGSKSRRRNNEDNSNNASGRKRLKRDSNASSTIASPSPPATPTIVEEPTVPPPPVLPSPDPIPDVELVLKPRHSAKSITGVDIHPRFLKTSQCAFVEHLCVYLAVRLNDESQQRTTDINDKDTKKPERRSARVANEPISPTFTKDQFTFYMKSDKSYTALLLDKTLEQVKLDFSIKKSSPLILHFDVKN